jgi:hypothetical protein
MMYKDKKQCECGTSRQVVRIPAKSGNPKTLKIKWQRLVYDGKTCPRCGLTEEELNKAVSALRRSLAPLGIEVISEKEELSVSEFEKDPLRSNRIWINDRPLEDYIKGNVGQSPCCDVCGDSECRTLEIKGRVYETVPSEIIIQSGLTAASRLINARK